MWVLLGEFVSDPCLRQTSKGIHHIFDSERNLSLFSIFFGSIFERPGYTPRDLGVITVSWEAAVWHQQILKASQRLFPLHNIILIILTDPTKMKLLWGAIKNAEEKAIKMWAAKSVQSCKMDSTQFCGSAPEFANGQPVTLYKSPGFLVAWFHPLWNKDNVTHLVWKTVWGLVVKIAGKELSEITILYFWECRQQSKWQLCVQVRLSPGQREGRGKGISSGEPDTQKKIAEVCSDWELSKLAGAERILKC